MIRKLLVLIILACVLLTGCFPDQWIAVADSPFDQGELTKITAAMIVLTDHACDLPVGDRLDLRNDLIGIKADVTNSDLKVILDQAIKRLE